MAIFVASKLPWNLDCKPCREEEFFDPAPGGGTTKKRWLHFGESIILRGTAYPVLPTQVFEAWRPRAYMIGGFAITTIDADADCKRFVL
jgi:hypothetical protein